MGTSLRADARQPGPAPARYAPAFTRRRTPCPPLQAAPAPATSTGALYYAHQYGGIVLGSAACAGSIAGYDQGDPFMAYRLLAWMFVVLAALAIHETRPFRRMNYGDKPLPQGGQPEKAD